MIDGLNKDETDWFGIWYKVSKCKHWNDKSKFRHKIHFNEYLNWIMQCQFLFTISLYKVLWNIESFELKLYLLLWIPWLKSTIVTTYFFAQTLQLCYTSNSICNVPKVKFLHAHFEPTNVSASKTIWSNTSINVKWMLGFEVVSMPNKQERIITLPEINVV